MKFEIGNLKLGRDATINDLPAIVDIYNETIEGRMVTADLEPVSVASKLEWFEAHNPETRPLWVVEEDGKVIAWTSFQSFYGRPAYRHTAEVSIYITEQAQGKGLGKKLLEKAIEDCSKLDIKNLLGFIFAHNVASINLFKKYGFEPWGHLPGVAVLDGVERDLVIMGKKII